MGIRERKEREFQRREREVLDAALALFSDDGWQSVTVEQIAERAEIGKGTVYKHFESKDEIYAVLAAEFREAALAEVEAIDRSLPVLARLRQLIRVFWEQHRRAEAYQRLVEYCDRDDFRKGLSEPAQERLAELDARFQAVIDGVLQDGIDQGILPRKPLPALVFGPMAALQGAVRLLWSECQGPDLRPEHYLEEITNFILAGMLYQEWLADEGLDSAEAGRRAAAELEAVEAELGGGA